jgi:hypothetical protein
MNADKGKRLQSWLIRLFVLGLCLGLAACSKSQTSASGGGGAGAPTQLNWDQGNWNQTNWQ